MCSCSSFLYMCVCVHMCMCPLPSAHIYKWNQISICWSEANAITHHGHFPFCFSQLLLCSKPPPNVAVWNSSSFSLALVSQRIHHLCPTPTPAGRLMAGAGIMPGVARLFLTVGAGCQRTPLACVRVCSWDFCWETFINVYFIFLFQTPGTLSKSIYNNLGVFCCCCYYFSKGAFQASAGNRQLSFWPGTG